MSSKLLLIQLDQNMQQINEKSIKRPISYDTLKQIVIETFKINSFIMYYFDQTNKEINITDNEKFQRSSDLIFIVENKALDESIYERIYQYLSNSKMDMVEEKYLCTICSEKFRENPYYCYQCSKRICKSCLTNLNRNMNPLKCPFCKYELPFEKWFTLKNFLEEKQHHLELIEKNIKLKEQNLIYNQKESEFLKQIKILNALLKEVNKKVKNQESQILKKDEEIKKLKDEIIKLKNIIKNQIQEKNELILQKKEMKINQLKEEKKDSSNFTKKLNKKDNNRNSLNHSINEIQNNTDDYFIYNVKEPYIDKDGNVKILGYNFVNNNKGILIINDDIKLDHLVSKYKLQIGINKIKINMKKNQIIDYSDMFSYCSSLTDISPLKNWNVSNGENFSGMFSGCISLTDIFPIKHWNVSNGNNFRGMFSYCKLLNDISPLKKWNVSNGENFSYMFRGCESLIDISPIKNWNVSNGNNFSYMFSYCKLLDDISPLKNWNVCNGNNFSYMFSSLENVSEDVINNFKQLNSNFDFFN